MVFVDVECGGTLRHEHQRVGAALGGGANLTGCLVVFVQLAFQPVQLGEEFLAADGG